MNHDPSSSHEQEAPQEEQEILLEEKTQSDPFPAGDPPLRSFVATLFDVLEMFAWAVFAVLILFSLAFRLCRVEGRSMENTLYENETLLLSALWYEPQQDDIVVFHLTDPEKGLEKTLVKRVIATEGQTVEINFKEKTILVDGILYEDTHKVLKDYYDHITDLYSLTADYQYDHTSQIFRTVVPEGHLFVLGDNRNFSKDSRDADIAFVDARCVLGKVVLRFAPFTVFS